MTDPITRPDFVNEEHLEYMHDHIAHMSPARRNLASVFPDLSEDEIGQMQIYWMRILDKKLSFELLEGRDEKRKRKTLL